MIWAAKWRSENTLDGKSEYLLRWTIGDVSMVRLFRTREVARSYIRSEFGYIRSRPDLRAEPHGWKMPVAVKVEVGVKELF